MATDVSRINGLDGSKFNPMSQHFVDQTKEIREMTLDPDIGGSSYIPHKGSILPVYYPPDRSEGNPDVHVVGGAPESRTGKRFPTHSALSGEQFSTGDVEANIYRTAIEAHQSKRPDLAAGTWNVTSSEGEPEHPRAGQVDMDVSDIHQNKADALKAAEERGEEAIFSNQGAEETLTKHSPKHPDYKKP
jgi:hypothetical protein